jgi:lysophospholipase L1-like esterase
MSRSSGLRRSLIAASGCFCALVCLGVAIRVATAWKGVDLASIGNRPARSNGADLPLGEIIRPHPNDRIVYELRPGLRGRFLGQDLSINSLGMRSPERPLAKPPGTFRVVGIGDSVMFGWGVAAADTYLSILERDLEARFAGRHFEVWNLAVPGYNTVQEVESFAEKVDRLEPDLVIVGWVGNDMDLPNFLAEPPDPWLLRRSFLLDLVESRIGALGGREESSGLFDVPADPRTKRLAMPLDDIPPRYRPLVGWDNMADAFRRLASIAKQRGIPAVALLDAGPARLHRLCAAAGFLVVDSQPAVLRYEKEHGVERYTALRLSATDTHPNTVGHAVIAESLLESLLRAGVPR